MKRRRADKFGASLYDLKTSPNFAFGNEDEHSIVQTQKNEIRSENPIKTIEFGGNDGDSLRIPDRGQGEGVVFV